MGDDLGLRSPVGLMKPVLRIDASNGSTEIELPRRSSALTSSLRTDDWPE